MSKNRKKEKETRIKDDGLGRISRREFAIGSVAAIGSAPGLLSDMAADTPPFKLDISEEVRRIMIDRHILEDDLIKVIDNAEKTGVKLYRQDCDRFMAKLRMNEVYFYSEYSPIEGGYRIHNTYSHRFFLEEGM
ncbi:MAG: hypothetical protein JXR49_19915 [Acidobacteria bacterium]|nr:hypothetical protein [Acidobacteriota bacterium]